jgi:orotate phosphoribosyltransferase
MDDSESCLQFNIEEIGWVERQGGDMNWVLEWNKRRKRRKKLQSLIQSSVKVGICRGTSGKQLDYYVDCRPLIANSSIRITIIKLLYDLIGHSKNIIFAGPQTSGAILATEMSLFRNTNAIIINLNKEEVIYPYNIDLSDKKIVIVDDVLTTGYTIEKCLDLINLPVSNILCIFNRSNIKEIRGISVDSILNYRDIKIG